MCIATVVDKTIFPFVILVCQYVLDHKSPSPCVFFCDRSSFVFGYKTHNKFNATFRIFIFKSLPLPCIIWYNGITVSTEPT